MSILKVIYLVPLFFQIFYSLVPKIEICLKYFLNKNPQSSRSGELQKESSKKYIYWIVCTTYLHSLVHDFMSVL